MVINLFELLSNEGISKQFDVQLDMNEFRDSLAVYPIVSKPSFVLEISNAGKRRVHVKGDVSLSLSIPCDRCLKDVKTDIEFTIDRMIIMDDLDSEGIEVEEKDFMDGNNLDVDALIFPEILINLPAKVLCKSDCKGLCFRCGADLNLGECGCDRQSLDPRMSVIQDIFNNRKEV